MTRDQTGASLAVSSLPISRGCCYHTPPQSHTVFGLHVPFSHCIHQPRSTASNLNTPNQPLYDKQNLHRTSESIRDFRQIGVRYSPPRPASTYTRTRICPSVSPVEVEKSAHSLGFRITQPNPKGNHWPGSASSRAVFTDATQRTYRAQLIRYPATSSNHYRPSAQPLLHSHFTSFSLSSFHHQLNPQKTRHIHAGSISHGIRSAAMPECAALAQP